MKKIILILLAAGTVHLQSAYAKNPSSGKVIDLGSYELVGQVRRPLMDQVQMDRALQKRLSERAYRDLVALEKLVLGGSGKEKL